MKSNPRIGVGILSRPEILVLESWNYGELEYKKRRVISSKLTFETTHKINIGHQASNNIQVRLIYPIKLVYLGTKKTFWIIPSYT